MTAHIARPARTSGTNQALRYVGSQLRIGNSRRTVEASLISAGIASFSMIEMLTVQAKSVEISQPASFTTGLAVKC
jgi:hypothetical protein